MKVYTIELLDEFGKLKEVKLEVAEKIEEMTFKNWVGFHLLRDAWPDWFKDFSKLSATDQREATKEWSNEQLATYWLSIAQIVNNFTKGGGLEEVLELDAYKNKDTHDAGLELVAANILKALADYKPKPISEFTHNGHTYVLPKSEALKIGKIKQTLTMANVKTGQIIEALQREHIYGGKDKNGKMILKDARYHTDLALVACVSRKKIDGELEVVPLGMSNFSTFINKRMEELTDLPATVALDASFFLLDSNYNSLKAVIQRWPSKNQKQRREKRREKRRRKGRKR